MPDVNLLKDTQQPDNQSPKRRDPLKPELTDPSLQPKKSISDTLRSLLGRRAAPPLPATSSSMSVQRAESGQRVLNDKTTPANPSIAPLPDDEDFNVNLLTEDVIGSFNVRHRLIQLGLLAVGAAALVVISYVGLNVYERSINQDVEETKARTIAVRNSTAALQDDLAEAQQVSDRLATLELLISKHIRWTRFFDRLERYTLPQITYGSGFSGSLTTELTFSASADSFERVAQQYLVYKQAISAGDFITAFTINGATKTVQNDAEVVAFNVSLTLVPSIFKNPPVKTSSQPTNP